MTGERVGNRCPTCGGELTMGLATVPFVLHNDRVVVIKNVPAEICRDCHEPFMDGRTTDQVMALLKQLQTLGSEVSVISFPAYEMA